MNPSFRMVDPDRLQIQEGGGCLSIFGLPFLAAGVFLILSLLGIVPVSNADDLPLLVRPLLVIMALAFTTVGAALVFGRSWTTIDRAQRTLSKQWGLLVPLHERTVPIDSCTLVTLGFVAGDSDTADSFPVALKAPGSADRSVHSGSNYARAREYARAVAEHLHLEIEDATTDHPVRLTAGEFDVPLRQRRHRQTALENDAVRPPDARSRVTRDGGAVTIVIPSRPKSVLLLGANLIPITIALVFVPRLLAFFRQSRTPEPVALVFLGFLTLLFGVLPIMTIVNAFIRSRRGATIVDVSTERLRIRERGAWTTATVASYEAGDILDVDYSSRESVVAASTRAVEQQVRESYPSEPAVSARVERMVASLTRFVKGKGITVKTRTGLRTFGQGLDDAESLYLRSVVRRALAG